MSIPTISQWRERVQRVPLALLVFDGRRRSDERPPYLSIGVILSVGGRRVYELAGELDIAGVGYVHKKLCEAKQPVVVDLSQLTFIDAAGISVLLAARCTLESRGYPVEFRRAPTVIRRVFEAIDAADLLEERTSARDHGGGGQLISDAMPRSRSHAISEASPDVYR